MRMVPGSVLRDMGGNREGRALSVHGGCVAAMAA
jgi:hypothetical protein